MRNNIIHIITYVQLLLLFYVSNIICTGELLVPLGGTRTLENHEFINYRNSENEQLNRVKRKADTSHTTAVYNETIKQNQVKETPNKTEDSQSLNIPSPTTSPGPIVLQDYKTKNNENVQSDYSDPRPNRLRAALRGFYVMLGIGCVVVVFISFKAIRLRRRRAVRKYRVLAKNDDQEMFPLAADMGDDDEEIFNAANLLPGETK